MSYVVDDKNWLSLGAIGIKGGTVYVYTGGTGAAVDVISNLATIKILSGDTIYISQNLNITSAVTIDFYACMGEVAAGDAPTSVYTALFNKAS